MRDKLLEHCLHLIHINKAILEPPLGLVFFHPELLQSQYLLDHEPSFFRVASYKNIALSLAYHGDATTAKTGFSKNRYKVFQSYLRIVPEELGHSRAVN